VQRDDQLIDEPAPTARQLAAPAGAGAVAKVTTLRVPCGSSMGGVGEELGVRGPLGTGWDTEAAAGQRDRHVADQRRQTHGAPGMTLGHLRDLLTERLP
jgi:hypothetical protein